MTDRDVAPSAVGWYPDPEGTAASRFWDGAGWTAHVRGRPLRCAPAVTATDTGRIAPIVGLPRNRMATAGLALGILALVLDVLLVPTILGVVFGAVGMSRAAGRGGVGRVRAFVGLALALVAVPLQGAIAVPLLLAVQNEAHVAVIRSDIENQALNGGVRLADLRCPAGLRPMPGERFTCGATTSAGRRLLIDVVLGGDERPLPVSARLR